MGSVIVCGFYTEDYRRWLIPLVESLDRLGQAHDFVLAEKAGRMWETNTMAKARHILAAMDGHPDEVIVWLDVDCIVLGDLSPLADIRGDVAFRMHSKFRRHHKGSNFRAQSGTMVFRPTAEARRDVPARPRRHLSCEGAGVLSALKRRDGADEARRAGP
jgi:hypothetical protein